MEQKRNQLNICKSNALLHTPFTVQNAKSIPIFAQAKNQPTTRLSPTSLFVLQKLSNFIVIHHNCNLLSKILKNTSNNQSLSYRAFNKSLFKIVQEICALYSYRMRIRANSIEILPNTHLISTSITSVCLIIM